MLNSFFEINAEYRVVLGTVNSNRLRRLSNVIPGVIYINNKKSIHISITCNYFVKLISDFNIYFSLIHIDLKDCVYKVVLKEIQYHPCNNYILHLDFKSINESDFIVRKVPINFINLDKSIAIKSGAVLLKNFSYVSLKCSVLNLIKNIDIDVSNFLIGYSFYISYIKLPEGCFINKNFYFKYGKDVLIFKISIPKKNLENKDAVDVNKDNINK